MLKLVLKSAPVNEIPKDLEGPIGRMGLLEPKNLEEKFYQKLLITEMKSLS